MSEQRAEYKAEGIPSGYMRDAVGRLVPLDLVSEPDRLQDDLVRELFGQIETLSREAMRLKGMVLANIEAFVELCNDSYGVKRGGSKGNVTLMSYDGRLKIVRAMDDKLTLGPQMQAARSLIRECAKEWTDGARKELQVVVDEVLGDDNKGEFATSRVLSLLRWKIEDTKWQRAMDALSEAVVVCGQTTYIRAYRRTGEDNHWERVALG